MNISDEVVVSYCSTTLVDIYQKEIDLLLSDVMGCDPQDVFVSDESTLSDFCPYRHDGSLIFDDTMDDKTKDSLWLNYVKNKLYAIGQSSNIAFGTRLVDIAEKIRLNKET